MASLWCIPDDGLLCAGTMHTGGKFGEGRSSSAFRMVHSALSAISPAFPRDVSCASGYTPQLRDLSLTLSVAVVVARHALCRCQASSAAMIVHLMSSALSRRAVTHSFRASARHFSHTAARDASWGFIGLGAMGVCLPRFGSHLKTPLTKMLQAIPWRRTYELRSLKAIP